MATGLKTIWTQSMDNFLIENYQTLTNMQLANTLGLKITVTRIRLNQLGCKRFEMEYWTKEQLQYLLENYKTQGNQRLANNLNLLMPKCKKWTKNHIVKKLKYLGLKRTKNEYDAICSFESSEGGLRFTALQNSSSINMHPKWIAQQIAWRNKHLQEHILNHHPELIEAKKNQLLIKRKIKNHGTK